MMFEWCEIAAAVRVTRFGDVMTSEPHRGRGENMSHMLYSTGILCWALQGSLLLALVASRFTEREHVV